MCVCVCVCVCVCRPTVAPSLATHHTHTPTDTQERRLQSQAQAPAQAPAPAPAPPTRAPPSVESIEGATPSTEAGGEGKEEEKAGEGEGGMEEDPALAVLLKSKVATTISVGIQADEDKVRETVQSLARFCEFVTSRFHTHPHTHAHAHMHTHTCTRTHTHISTHTRARARAHICTIPPLNSPPHFRGAREFGMRSRGNRL